jgi:hypothetical protein
MDDIINAARVMKPRSMAKEFSGVMKEVLGTAQSVGCTIDGKLFFGVIFPLHISSFFVSSLQRLIQMPSNDDIICA